ncbi:MAG: hypothetical protein V5A22_06000 [Salinivenus sp.]
MSNPYSSGCPPSGPTGAYDRSRRRGQQWVLRAARGLMVSAYRAADGETAVIVACAQEREGDALSVPARSIVTYMEAGV